MTEDDGNRNETWVTLLLGVAAWLTNPNFTMAMLGAMGLVGLLDAIANEQSTERECSEDEGCRLTWRLLMLLTLVGALLFNFITAENK